MTHTQRKVAEGKSDIIRDVPLACADEAAAVAFLERMRWGDTPCCPRCGDTNVTQIKAKDGTRGTRFLWRCYGCKSAKQHEQFTWRVGTAAEDSRIPARCWTYALWRASTSKKGVAALEIKRQTGLSYKSALFLMHRIRFGMGSGLAPRPLLDGDVQVDETYVGGRPRNPVKGGRGCWREDKTAVVGALDDEGQLRLRVMPTVNGTTIGRAIKKLVDRDKSRLVTDEAFWYIRHGKKFRDGHETVCHKTREYVRDGFTTNGVESTFSLLKRGLMGIWHNVSPAYLPLYLNEVEFRHNRNKFEDGERLRETVRALDGKRIRKVSLRSYAYELRLR